MFNTDGVLGDYNEDMQRRRLASICPMCTRRRTNKAREVATVKEQDDDASWGRGSKLGLDVRALLTLQRKQ